MGLTLCSPPPASERAAAATAAGPGVCSRCVLQPIHAAVRACCPAHQSTYLQPPLAGPIGCNCNHQQPPNPDTCSSRRQLHIQVHCAYRICLPPLRSARQTELIACRTYLRGGPTEVLLSVYTEGVQGGLTNTKLHIYNARGELIFFGATMLRCCAATSYFPARAPH